MADAGQGDGMGEARVPAIGRDAMAQAARVIRPAVAGVSPLQQLLSVPADWVAVENEDSPCPGAGPRLQSPRYGGIAPIYPKSDHMQAMRNGTLIVFPGGFVLEPSDPCRPCLHVPSSTVRAVTFYRDAFDVAVSAHDRLVIRTGAVEDIDSIFQAYFWTPVV